MAKWLDKYENGGEYLGTTNKGFNYNGAWGGPSMQMGGNIQPPMAGADQTVPMYQMGGYVYPTTFVPQAQKGREIKYIPPPPMDYELQYSGDESKKYPVSSDVMKQIVSTSVGMNYDPKRALAVALQESGIGRTDPNYFHVLTGKTKSGKDRIPKEYQNLTMDELGIQLLKDKQKLANKLGYTTPEMELQTYNGLGRVFRDTEKDYHGFEMQKIYGVPIPEEGIDMEKNPLYGKRIMELEKEVINKDPYVNQLVDYYNKFYSNPDSVYYTKASELEPIEIVAPKANKNPSKSKKQSIVDELKDGGSVPGSVGFTYARTQGIPSEGPYGKKTLPSAQKGLTFLEPNDPKLPSNNNRSELAMSIGGEDGEPALLIPSFKYGQPILGPSDDPYKEFLRTGDYLGGPFKTWQEADEWERNVRHPYVEKGQSIPTPLRRWGKDFENGGSMSYYQHGLDWKPKSISRDGSVVKDDMGYWNPDNHGKIVEIDSPNITMKGVNQDLIGVSDEGDVQYMKPGKDYKFKGKKVKEYPVGKYGVNQQDEKTVQHLDQLLNFTNKPKAKNGWLDKYK